MQKPNLRDVRVLIVEDEQIQVDGIVRSLDKIDNTIRLNWGINSFKFDLACSVEHAKAFLAAADPPYDILILDLGLPEKEGSTSNPPQNGQMLLEGISRTEVKEIIIVSSFYDYETVIKALRKGAVDFIAKPYPREMLQTRVVESWKRVLEKDCAHILQDRIIDLAYYSERELAYYHTVCFNSFAQDVLNKTTELEEHTGSRFGLDRQRDSQDDLIRGLTKFEASVSTAKKKWITLQVHSLSDEEMLSAEAIEPMLCEIERGLLPGFIVKKVKIESCYKGGTKILTFKNDLKFKNDAWAILKEILLGALAESPDYDSPGEDTNQSESIEKVSKLIKIEIGVEDGKAIVSITDNLLPISTGDAMRINECSFTTSRERFSRVWGLSVMQQIAVLGGGRLEVKPQEQGNIITYSIPLDSNA